MNNKNRNLLALATVILSVAMDQITKIIAQNCLTYSAFVGVIGDAVGFELIYNPGAFLGMFSDARWAFMLPSMLIIAVMTVWLCVKRSPTPLFVVSVCLLIGGGIGNMIDRIFLGHVIDFISLRFIRFPNFNVADSCVTIGCILFAICALFTKEDVFDVRLGKKDTPASPPEDSNER